MAERNNNFFKKILDLPWYYLVSDVDVASRCKVAGSLTTNKENLLVLVLGAICKNGGVSKYPMIFQGDNGSEFKSDVTKLLKKHNADIQTIATKY